MTSEYKWRHLIGTLAHNRSFTARELEEYARSHPGMRAAVRAGAGTTIKSLVDRGYLKRVGRTQFYPTARGWDWIESARVVSRDPERKTRNSSKRGAWIGSMGYFWSPVRQRWFVVYSPKKHLETASLIKTYETKAEAMRAAKGHPHHSRDAARDRKKLSLSEAAREARSKLSTLDYYAMSSGDRSILSDLLRHTRWKQGPSSKGSGRSTLYAFSIALRKRQR